MIVSCKHVPYMGTKLYIHVGVLGVISVAYQALSV
jgi:hypothetical protein